MGSSIESLSSPGTIAADADGHTKNEHENAIRHVTQKFEKDLAAKQKEELEEQLGLILGSGDVSDHLGMRIETGGFKYVTEDGYVIRLSPEHWSWHPDIDPELILTKEAA